MVKKSTLISQSKNKVISHPDFNLIMKWISDGQSDRDIAQTLKDKYPAAHHGHLVLSYKTIYNFRMEYMPNGKLSNIAASEANTPRWAIKNREVTAALAKNSAYQEALAKIKEDELQITRKLIDVMTLLETRMEVVYNELAASNKIDERNERLLLEQMKILLGILGQQDKINNATTAANQTQDINVNINIVKDHASVIREAIRETLSEVDPALSIEFMERVNLKMKELDYAEETGIIPV